MNTASARLSVHVGQQFACIKVVGRANFSSSVDFKTVLNELWSRGYTYFVLDLSECVLMDSTFLGVLAGFGLKMIPSQKAAERAIELLDPNPRIVELLENLGVLNLFRLTKDGVAPTSCNIEFVPTPANPDREELIKACIEAHKNLIEINPENRPKFVDVNFFLTNELKNLRGARS